MARIENPLAENPAAAAVPIAATAPGRVFTCLDRFVVLAGDVVMKIAGDRPLPGKGGKLLTA